MAAILQMEGELVKGPRLEALSRRVRDICALCPEAGARKTRTIS